MGLEAAIKLVSAVMPFSTTSKPDEALHFPDVAVSDLTDQKNLLTSAPDEIELGVSMEMRDKLLLAFAESGVQAVLAGLMEAANHVYLLTWKGNKVPRGVELESKIIHTTMHNIVSDLRGNLLGYYQRIITFGGESGMDQAMLVFTYDD